MRALILAAVLTATPAMGHAAIDNPTCAQLGQMMQLIGAQARPWAMANLIKTWRAADADEIQGHPPITDFILSDMFRYGAIIGAVCDQYPSHTLESAANVAYVQALIDIYRTN